MSFFKSVAILVSGTAIGHGITAATLPLLSRLYSPADFSLLAVFSGIVAIAAVAVCLRFDIAITIPRSHEEALNVAILSLISALGVTGFLSLAILFCMDWISTATNQVGLQKYLWLLPLTVLLAGFSSTLQSWNIRHGSFPVIARSRILQSGSAASIQLGLGTLGVAPGGLLLGSTVNSGAAVIALGYRFIKSQDFDLLQSQLTKATLKYAFEKYSHFPKYSTPEALLNSAALQVPIILIATLSNGPEAGYLMLAMSVMQAPMSLFGTAVGQVYISHASGKHRERELGKFSRLILARLAKIGVIPICLAGLLSPAIFPVIFGERWEPAGWLISWMTPWFVFQFLASPLAITLHVVGRQKLAFYFQGIGFFLRTGAVLLAHKMDLPLAESFAVANGIFYFSHLLLILKISKTSETATSCEDT